MTKICSKCGQKKLISCFKRTVRSNECKDCRNQRRKARYHKDTEYRKKSITKACLWFKRLTPEKRLERNKIRRERYNEEYLKQNREWQRANPEKMRQYKKKAYINIKSNPVLAIRLRISGAIRRSLSQNNSSKNGCTWEKLVGYTAKDLRKHIEKQFTSGMTWDLFLQGKIHIDHIIPVSFFKFTSPDDVEFKMCWRLENLQPLWAIDNMKKNDKIIIKVA
jgi:hypothetical protein